MSNDRQPAKGKAWIVLQFIVVLAAIWAGARFSAVGLGLWGGFGLLVLVLAFGVSPSSPPIDVMLIILAVIMLLLTRVNVDDVPKTPTQRAGVLAVIGIFGRAWLSASRRCS